MAHDWKRRTLPPPVRSACLLVRLQPANTGLFRFLLEACGHTAYFTVLERHTALLKLVYSPHMEQEVRATLARIAECVPLCVESWPKRL